MAAPHFLSGSLDSAGGSVALYTRGGGRVAAHLEIAGDSAARKRGLRGRVELPPDTAFVIAPCSAIHTFGMRFAIDVIFAARDGRVVRIAANVPPRRIAVAWGAFAAVEMAAGEVARNGVSVGDHLGVRPGSDPGPTRVRHGRGN